MVNPRTAFIQQCLTQRALGGVTSTPAPDERIFAQFAPADIGAASAAAPAALLNFAAACPLGEVEQRKRPGWGLTDRQMEEGVGAMGASALHEGESLHKRAKPSEGEPQGVTSLPRLRAGARTVDSGRPVETFWEMLHADGERTHVDIARTHARTQTSHARCTSYASITLPPHTWQRESARWKPSSSCRTLPRSCCGLRHARAATAWACKKPCAACASSDGPLCRRLLLHATRRFNGRGLSAIASVSAPSSPM